MIADLEIPLPSEDPPLSCPLEDADPLKYDRACKITAPSGSSTLRFSSNCRLLLKAPKRRVRGLENENYIRMHTES